MLSKYSPYNPMPLPEGGGTEMIFVTELFVRLGSDSFCVTIEKLVMLPNTPGLVTRICTSALLSGGSIPRLQVTIPPALEHPPWLAAAETKETPAGRTLDRITPVAAEGPGLKTAKA